MSRPTHAMLLAAGLGTRMRPITDRIPKPLVEVCGRSLLERSLDALEAAGVTTSVVNVHYKAEQIEERLVDRQRPRIIISDERAQLLETGGGVVKALPHLGHDPFFHLNADTIWIDGPRPNLERLADAFDPGRMDALLLLADVATSVGYDGRGDFTMDAQGRLTRRVADTAPYVYAGVAILTPGLFAGYRPEPFSLNRQFDAALAAGRLHGLRLEGLWMHVGTPASIGEAEAAMRAAAA